MKIEPYDGLTLSENQLKVLCFLAEHYDSFGEGPVYTFKGMAEETMIEVRLVRLACRALLRKGLAEIAKMWNEESGLYCGSGYVATKNGADVIERMEELERVREEANTL